MTVYQKVHYFILGLCVGMVCLLAAGTLAHDANTENLGPTAVLAAGQIGTDPKSWDIRAIKIDPDGYVICSDQRKPK